MNNMSPKNCVTCGELTKFKCHCYGWGYPELYFCSKECKKDHLEIDHESMKIELGKRKISDRGSTEATKKPALKISSFGAPQTKKCLLSKPDLRKSAVPGNNKIGLESRESVSDAGKSVAESKKEDFLTIPDTSFEDETVRAKDVSTNEPPEDNVKENVQKEKKTEKGPLLIIAAITSRQKARKTNDLFRTTRETLMELKLLRPNWNFTLKTESTDEEKKIKKQWKFSSRPAVSANASFSLVKRRFIKVVQCLRVIEAMNPDLMFNLITDKPKGTGKKTDHQYKSPKDRKEVAAVEDLSNMADDVETNVEIDDEEEEDTADAADTEEDVLECTICKMIIQDEEVALFCGTGKKVDQHHGTHVRCLGFYKVQKGDKFHKDLSVHYRCPDHSE